MKKRLSVLFLLGAFLLLFTGQAWAKTVLLYPSQMSTAGMGESGWFWSTHDLNRSGDNYTLVGREWNEGTYNYDYRVFVYFDLSPFQGQKMVSSNLSWFIKNESSNAGATIIGIGRSLVPTTSWSGSTYPSVSSHFYILDLPKGQPSVTTNYSTDVNSVVNDWNSGTYANYGFSFNNAFSPEKTLRRIGYSNTVKPSLKLIYYNLNFSNVTSNSMTISWDTTGDSGYTYELSRNGVVIYSGSNSSFTDTGLSPAITYKYKLRVYADGKWSDYTTEYSKLTLPATPATPTASLSGLAWSNDANNPGRGKVVLSWPAVAGASKYGIYLFDGNTYWKVDETTSTSWDSSARKVFPSEAALNALGDNTVNTNLFVVPTTGQDLPDRPGKLYRKTVGTTYDTANNYWVCITAFNASGETPRSTPLQFTLPDRTDTVAPTGSIKINDGATKVTSIDVTLNISASDDKSGLYQVQFSNDNVSWSPWESYTTSKAWQIGAGINQQQTVYMRLKDQAGNISNIISVSVFFANDATPPIIKVIINNGAKQTDSNKVTLYVEASDDFSTIDQISMRVSTNGIDWRHFEGDSWVSGWGAYRYANADFDLGPSGGNKPVFVQAKDAAGNIANATVSIFYVTADTLPGSTATNPTANATWGINQNGKYVNVNDEIMQVIQGNSVSVNLTGLTNTTELITSFDGINWSQPDRIPAGSSVFTKDVTWPDEGKKTLYMKVRNEAGVESPTIIRRYLVDHTAPEIEVGTASGATMTSGNSIDLLIKARDNVSTSLAYRVNGGTWNVLPSNGIISASVSGSAGLKRITIEVVDEAGNVTQEVVNIWKA